MAKKTRKDFNAEISIPEGISTKIIGNKVKMKKENNELEKSIHRSIKVELKENKILLSAKNARKAARREFGTAKGHLKNMIEGLEKGYEYELEICNVHFPINVTFDKLKSEFIIKNMLGEKYPRIIKAKENIEVEIRAPNIKIKSFDLEAAGQTAADLEKKTKIRNRDRNKFQDGIFITKKPGREFI